MYVLIWIDVFYGNCFMCIHGAIKKTNFDFIVAEIFIKMVYSGNIWQSDKVAHEAQYNNK